MQAGKFPYDLTASAYAEYAIRDDGPALYSQPGPLSNPESEFDPAYQV
jgi:hypothetical protein